MQVIDCVTIKVEISFAPSVGAIKERRTFLHEELGWVCRDCGKRKKLYKMHMHHEFYPRGYSPTWTKEWQHADEKEFWKVYYPEIMEACVLLCARCHRKRHGIRSKKNSK